MQVCSISVAQLGEPRSQQNVGHTTIFTISFFRPSEEKAVANKIKLLSVPSFV